MSFMWLLLPPKCNPITFLCAFEPLLLCCHTWMHSWWEEQFPGLQQEIRHLLKGRVYRIYDLGLPMTIWSISLAQQETVTSLDGEYKVLWCIFKVFLQKTFFLIFGTISLHRKWMILPIIIDSYDPASAFRNRTQDLEDCLSVAQNSPHLAYSLYRQTYTKPLRNNLSVF